MADVVICYAPEDEAALRRLAEAVGRAGYSAWHGDAAGTDAVTGQIAAAKAVIVIWSEAAAASEWVKAEANVARGLKKLIQVTADGRPPPIPFDRAEMISILTWRGEEDHPAWRGVKAGLERLCGPPPERTVAAAAPVAAVAAAAPVAAVPAAAPPAPDDLAPSAGPNRLLIVLIVLLALAALAAAAWYWMQQGSQAGSAPSLELNMAGAEPAPAEPQAAPAPSEALPAAAEPAPEIFDRQATIQGVDHAMVRSTPAGIGFDIARVEPGEVFMTYEQSGDWWRVRTAAGRVGFMNVALIRLRDGAAPTAEPVGKASPPAATAQRPDPRRPRGPRIRKENSEVMEAFCNGAGAGTPQCRAFRRSGY